MFILLILLISCKSKMRLVVCSNLIIKELALNIDWTITHATGGVECGNSRCQHGYKHPYGLFFDDFLHFFTNSVENSHDFSVFWHGFTLLYFIRTRLFRAVAVPLNTLLRGGGAGGGSERVATTDDRILIPPCPPGNPSFKGGEFSSPPIVLVSAVPPPILREETYASMLSNEKEKSAKIKVV